MEIAENAPNSIFKGIPKIGIAKKSISNKTINMSTSLMLNSLRINFDRDLLWTDTIRQVPDSFSSEIILKVKAMIKRGNKKISTKLKSRLPSNKLLGLLRSVSCFCPSRPLIVTLFI